MSIISSAKSYVRNNPGMFIAESIAVLLLLVLVVSWLKPSQDGGQGEPICKAVQEYPWDNTTQLVNVKSPDFKALARFGGVLTMNDPINGPQYLPILAKFIKFSTANGGEWHQLVILSDCAELTFRIDGQGPKFSVSRIVVISELGNKQYLCSADINDISYDSSDHYSCDKSRAYICSGLGPDRKLVVHGLEFEINGETDMIKQGKYSTPSKVC